MRFLGLKTINSVAFLFFLLAALACGQAPPQTPANPKAAASVDLTGYWVSVVTEDWRYRMITPSKGDYESVPLNPAGITAADAWDPAKDEAAGAQCKSYGAAAIMRVPGRIHITWQDDNTLRIDTDAGTQTRLLHFGAWKAAGGAATLQGDSLAQWEGKGTGSGPVAAPSDLKVVTTQMLAGYLRKNGVPYSANTVLTEYYDVIRGVDGNVWLTVTSMVDDPAFLKLTFITSSNFKKQADGAGWDPSPCSSR